MIKSNTKVLFNKVAPGGKSELARAGTCATERNPKPCHKGVQSQVGTVVPDGSSGSQEQETAPQERDEVATKTGTGQTCEVATCGLGRHARSVRNTANGLAHNDLQPLGRHDRNLRNKVFWSGIPWNIQGQWAVVR